MFTRYLNLTFNLQEKYFLILVIAWKLEVKASHNNIFKLSEDSDISLYIPCISWTQSYLW